MKLELRVVEYEEEDPWRWEPQTFDVKLTNGEHVSLMFWGDALHLEPSDRAYLFGLVDSLRSYEAAKGDGATCEETAQVQTEPTASFPSIEELAAQQGVEPVDDPSPREAFWPDDEEEAPAARAEVEPSEEARCDRCGKVYDTPHGLHVHRVTACSPRECPDCGKPMKSISGLAIHQKRFCAGPPLAVDPPSIVDALAYVPEPEPKSVGERCPKCSVFLVTDQIFIWCPGCAWEKNGTRLALPA